MSGWLLLSPCFTEIPVCNANNVNPDQTPRSAASDLGLHCMPMFLFNGTLGLNAMAVEVESFFNRNIKLSCTA